MPSSNLPGRKQVTPLAKYAGIDLESPFPNVMQHNLSNWRISNMVLTCPCLALLDNFPRALIDVLVSLSVNRTPNLSSLAGGHQTRTNKT